MNLRFPDLSFLARNRFLLFPGILVLCAVISWMAYSNVLSSGIFIFDDYDYLLNNPIIQNIENFRNYTDPRYIGYLTFFLNYQQGGMDPYNFHLFNVVIHTLNAFLVFLLITLIIRATSPRENELPVWWTIALPLLAALLFLCHPLSTQSVSYITQRFTSLSAFFYLLAVVLYLGARIRFERLPHSALAYLPYACSLVATALAMKTKEISFTIPFTLLFLEMILFNSSYFRLRRLVFLVPYALTLLIIPLSLYGPKWGLVPAGVQGVTEITRLDKIYDLEQRSRYEYVITQFRVVVTYLRLLIFPYPQRVVYDFAASRSFWSFSVIFSFLLIVSLHFYAIVSWIGAAFSEGRKSLERRMIAIGILWFFITISIESSLIPIKDLIFEHRTYLPSLGILLVVSVYLLRLAEWFKPAIDVRIKVTAITAILATALSITAYNRNWIWTNEILFWQDVVEKAPNKPIGYHNRGFAYAKQGYLQQALKDMDITVKYFSQDPNLGMKWESADLSRFNMSKAYSNRANIRQALGMLVEAEDDRQKARELFAIPTAQQQLSKDERLKLAEEYSKRGDHKKTLEELDKVVQEDPENPGILINRGNALSGLKRHEEALKDFNKVIKLRPDVAVTYHNRALALFWLKRDSEAMKDLKKACSMDFKPACDSIEFVRKNGGKFPGS